MYHGEGALNITLIDNNRLTIGVFEGSKTFNRISIHNTTRHNRHYSMEALNSAPHLHSARRGHTHGIDFTACGHIVYIRLMVSCYTLKSNRTPFSPFVWDVQHNPRLGVEWVRSIVEANNEIKKVLNN